MPYVTPDLAVTGNFITAADGNRRRDNDEYLKGNAGPVALGNTLNVSGAITATSSISATAALGTSGATGGVNITDRVNGAQTWVVYASGGLFFLYDGSYGNVFDLGYGGPSAWNGGAGAERGINPYMLRHGVLQGFLEAGTITYGYSGDKIISQSFSGGPMNGWAVTYEYSGDFLVATRLRIGGTGGTIVRSIGYGYSGNLISTETHS